MLYFAVQIHSYEQLCRFDSEMLAELLNNAGTVLRNNGAQKVHEEAGLFIFAFPGIKSRDLPLLAAAFNQVKLLFEHFQQELYGYSFLVEYSKEQHTDAILRKLEITLRSVVDDEELWFTDSAKPYFEGVFSFVSSGILYRGALVQQTEKAQVFTETYRQFCSRQPYSQSLRDIIRTHDSEGIVLLYGPQLSGKEVILDAAIADFDDGDTYMPLYFYHHPEDVSMHGPFMRALLEGEALYEYMNKAAKAVWDSHKHILEAYEGMQAGRSFSDRNPDELLLLLEVLIAAHIRKADSFFSQTVLIAEDVDSFSDSAVQILTRLISSFSSNIPVVLTSRKPLVPSSMRAIPCRKLRIANVSREQIQSISKECLADVRISDTFIKGINGRMGNLYHALQYYTNYKKDDSNSMRIQSTEGMYSQEILRSIGEHALLIYYCVIIFRGILGQQSFEEFVEQNGVTRSRLGAILEELAKLGFIRDMESLIPCLPELRPAIEPEVLGLYPLVLKDAASYLCDNKDIYKSDSLMFFLADNGSSLQQKDFFTAYYNSISGNPFVKKTIFEDHDIARKLPHLKHLYDADFYLTRHELDEASEALKRYLPGLNPELDCEFKYLQARYQLQRGRRDNGLPIIKDLLMSVSKYQQYGASANILLGRVLLSKQRIIEGADYFEIAAGMASRQGDDLNYARAILYQAVAYFIHGNFGRSLALCLQIESICTLLGDPYVLFLHALLQGRIQFELGNYIEARKQFESALSLTSLYHDHRGRQILQAWAARAIIFNGQIQEGITILRNLDHRRETVLFIGEAHLIRHEYSTALEVLGEAENAQPMHMHLGENTPWMSGFDPIEGMSFNTIDDNIIDAYKGYCYSRLGEVEEGRFILQQLMRKTVETRKDPYNLLYLFLYSQVLPQNREQQWDDRLTILGKSVKLIQERMSRIEEARYKRDFMNLNYWNRHLLGEARGNNLV